MPRLAHFVSETRLGQPFRFLEETASTQEVLREWALEGAPEGALVATNLQTRGRGRRGRVWQTEPGQALLFSLLLRPSWPADLLPLLSLAAGVALCQAGGLGGLKWPNDWLAPDGRKLAGVLLESHWQGGQLAFVAMGVGVNVLAAPPQAAALCEFGPYNRNQVLQDFLHHFDLLYHNPQQIIATWSQLSYTLHRLVRVGSLEGIAEGLGTTGSLQIRSGADLIEVTAGDVDWVGSF